MNASTHRLLYRGSLSLPDSHLVLDGLTFSARLDSPSKHNHLLQNPLALALESMRGRPSLRFIDVVKLNDDSMWLDDSGGIELDIHPYATLTRVYFENIFCLIPFASTSKSTSGSPDTSDIGIKVALGDSDGPDTTEIIICARPTSSDDQKHLQLIVTRVVQRPVPQPNLPRLPRPDDPTPRKPPMIFGAGRNGIIKRDINKEKKGISKVGTKRQKLTNAAEGGSLLVDLGSGVRLGEGKKVKGGTDTLFKVPELPIASKMKGKDKLREEDLDVFGSMNMAMNDINGKVVQEAKRRRKRVINEDDGDGAEGVIGMERANKNAIKKCALDQLSSIKDPTSTKIDKSHPEFKEIFGWVYRGVGFALRAQIKAQIIDTPVIEHLVKNHVSMYVGGKGGSVAP